MSVLDITPEGPFQADIRELLRLSVCATAVITPHIGVTAQPRLLAESNPERVGMIIYNIPAGSLYIAYGSTASSATFVTHRIAADSTWVMPPPIYLGPISGVRNSGTGTVIVTELIATK